MEREEEKEEEKEQTKVWLSTNVPNMLRHKGGTYYGRFRVSGKRILKSLETRTYSVAKEKMRDEVDKIDRMRGAKISPQTADICLGALAEKYRTRFKTLEISQASIDDRERSLLRLLRTWKGFAEMKPGEITAEGVWTWAARLKEEGSGFKPNEARKVKKGASGSSVNKSITALQQILDIAVEMGLLVRNVARGKPPAGLKRLRRKNEPKPVHLPSHSEMQALLDEIEKTDRNVHPRIAEAQRYHRANAGELVRFMAYSGARLAEAGRAIWSDDHRDILIVHGTKTRKSIDRPVSINPSMRALLDRILARRHEHATATGERPPEGTDPILLVREAQKTIDAACRRLGFKKRLTHHTFRHLFATRCLESGVDPKTVAEWMGHSDGGILVLKLYGHVRPDHAAAAAAKVVF